MFQQHYYIRHKKQFTVEFESKFQTKERQMIPLYKTPHSTFLELANAARNQIPAQFWKNATIVNISTLFFV